jgi:hypothetical protein
MLESIETVSYLGTPILLKRSDVVIIPRTEECAVCGKFEIGILVLSIEGSSIHLCFNCIDSIKEQL